MAVWALLSISQTVKAADVTVYFQCPKDWRTPVCAYAYNDGADKNPNWDDAPAGSEYYTSTGVKLWRCTFDSKYKKVIFKEPYVKDLETKQTSKDGFLVTNNYVYTSGGPDVTLSEFEKEAPYTYTLRGGYDNGAWNNESSNFKYVGDGNYTYTFTATQTGEFRFRVNTSYTSKAALCPNVDVNTKRKKLTSTPEDVAYNDQNDASGTSMSDNYWFCDVTKGKKYTFTSTNDSYTRKLSVVTKVIKLWNGTSELKGSNGSYTLDLSSATADAKITLSIDDESYGLATAQTISAAGTTNVDFVLNKTAALTLTKGFIYSLSVTEDGKMTVVAAEKVNPVITADAGYYLVGNFFSKHNIDGGDPEDEINYSRLYFKFKDNGIVDHVHTYSMDIPASISAYMQILSVDDNNVKVVYGPGEIKAVSAATLNTNTSLTGTTLLKSSDLSKGGNYWSLTTRNDGTHDDDGMYTISFTESNGVPTNWTITHNAFKRVSYLISCAEGASAQPLYNKRGADVLTSSFTDETKEYVHFDGNSQYYAISNVVFSRDDNGTEQNPQPMYVAQKIDNSVHVLKGHDSRPTHSKLFLLGNGGEEYSTANNYNLLSPNENAIKFSLKGTYFVRINPSQGHREIAIENDHYGINVEIFTGTGTPDYPDAISMVGPAIASTTTTVGDKTTWNWASTAGDMTYDENDRCYKLVLNTTDDMVGKTFRFVGDHAITQNWYEDQTKANIQYPTTQGGFSDATVADPNYVNYTKNCTEENIKHANDILWNRGAGLWTVRFYIDKSQTGDNAVFYYTITGASKIYIPVTAHMGKLLRTYTSAVDVVPVDANVLIYAAQSYTKKNENNTGSGDETGTVKLYRLKYIPANQGVVLYSPNSPLGNGTPTKLEVVPAYSATVMRYSNTAYDYIEDWAKSAAKESMWVNTHENETWNNFLVPVLTDTNITQFYFDDQNNWTGRNFAFTRYSQTKTGQTNGVIEDNTTDSNPKKHDYFSFFRAAGTVKASYSYLMLPLTIMEGNGQILDQSQDNDTKLFSKSMVWFEGIDAPMDNETTGISELKNHVSNTDAAYYTLQGVKVAKPVKGIYIHQGKKVIVK